jgi:tRNA-(ms[2]io[6]A)-hydroxylase
VSELRLPADAAPRAHEAAWPEHLPDVLGVATAPGWAEVALADLPSTMSDHAHAEKKAALSALSMLSREPSRTDLVDRMGKLALEELGHLDRVLAHLRRRGWTLAADRADRYANRLIALRRAGGEEALVDRLLVSALIEARSWERLHLLALALGASDEAELGAFYTELAHSEAGHYRLFVQLAERECPSQDVRVRLGELAAAEAEIVAALPHEPRIH